MIAQAVDVICLRGNICWVCLLSNEFCTISKNKEIKHEDLKRILCNIPHIHRIKEDFY